MLTNGVFVTIRLYRIRVAWLLLLLAGVASDSSGQFEPYYLKYNSGLTVQPIFEGWSRNADRSFRMHFGYLNRNYVETPSVPVGSGNNVEPGGPDRGQPTFFYTRLQRKLFSVDVPADWGQKELVWSLTVNGKTEKAVGWLGPIWEIEPIESSSRRDVKNQPPTVVVTPLEPLTLPQLVTLISTVTDDGLPVPSPRSRSGSQASSLPPILQGSEAAPVNVPHVADGDSRPPVARSPGSGPRRPPGLSVTWLVWRGPASVTFEPSVATVNDGRAIVKGQFREPGTYVLQVQATDGDVTTHQNVNITVSPQQPSQQP